MSKILQWFGCHSIGAVAGYRFNLYQRILYWRQINSPLVRLYYRSHFLQPCGNWSNVLLAGCWSGRIEHDCSGQFG